MSDISNLAATSATQAATPALPAAAPGLPAAAPGLPAANASNPQLKKAAAQFEAIFVRQMLASARKTHFDDKLFSSQGMDTFQEQQDSHFADIAASRDAFGLTKMIEQRLSRQAGTTPAAPAATPAKGG